MERLSGESRARRNEADPGASVKRPSSGLSEGTRQDQTPAEFLAARDAALKEVIEEIQSAFWKVKRDDGVTLHQTKVIDSCGSDREMARARRVDTDKTWAEVTAKDIETYSTALRFLDPKGFHYYLPAFMVWSLRNYVTSDSATIDTTIYSLDVGNKKNTRERMMSRFELFDARQNRAVARFLRFMVDFGGGRVDAFMVEQAFEKYWKKFL